MSDESCGGAAKFTTKTLTSGTHSITATYNGNASFIGSSASLTQTVNGEGPAAQIFGHIQWPLR